MRKGHVQVDALHQSHDINESLFANSLPSENIKRQEIRNCNQNKSYNTKNYFPKAHLAGHLKSPKILN